MSMKLFPRRRTIWLPVLAAILLALVWYMFFVAPYRVELTRFTIRLPVKTPLRVLHISDLHSSGLGPREQLLLELVERTRPDLIAVTGDSVRNGSSCRAPMQLLDRLRAPLGVWMVPGNWEYWMAQDGMHVSIPTYGVASYAAGPQEVTVTAADVTGGSEDGSLEELREV